MVGELAPTGCKVTEYVGLVGSVVSITMWTVISEDARARLVAALPCVDAVILFDEATPLNLIRAVQPHVLVKGGDYTEEEVVGAADMKSWGGKVTLVSIVAGTSTTAILKKAFASLHEPSSTPIQ